MAQSGLFQLVINNDKFDRMLTATQYLKQRLDDNYVKSGPVGKRQIPKVEDISESHICHINSVYRPYVSVASEYIISDRQNGVLSSASTRIVMNCRTHGHFMSDTFMCIKIPAIGTLSPTADSPLYRYCAYPGLRLFENVALKSDYMIIDQYKRDDAVMHNKFFVSENHREGWDRCLGQEVRRKSTYRANGHTGHVDYSDGPQTYNTYQPELIMMIPGHFWFNEDASSAVPNGMLPAGQRTMTFDLEQLSNIVQMGRIDPSNPNNVIAEKLNMTSMPFEAALHVNHLFVNDEVHEIFANQIGFNLIRAHRNYTTRVTSSTTTSSEALLTSLKFPTEYLMVGFRSTALKNDFDRWWMMGTIKERSNETAVIAPAMVWNASVGAYEVVGREVVDASELEPVIKTLGLTSNGIEIYKSTPGLFYNAYMPIKYNKKNVVHSPRDSNAFLIRLCLYPGEKQPSGFLNMSTLSNTSINFTTVDNTTDIEMVVSASSLNFVIQLGDRLDLKYAY